MSDIDITEILRQKAKGTKTELGDYWCDNWCLEAANEIDELRFEVIKLNNEIDSLYEQRAGEDI